MNEVKPQLVTLAEAIRLLQAGKVGVMPTDTVYGLVAQATDVAAVTQLYELKNRERKPGTIIAASVDQLLSLEVPANSIDAVKQWWPNPVSFILPLPHAYIHQGLGDVAMRVVADASIRSLLEKTGPLLTSSANLPGQPESKNISQAWQYFGNKVDFYVDGGDISDRLPSTIAKPTPNGLTILRQGSVYLD